MSDTSSRSRPQTSQRFRSIRVSRRADSGAFVPAREPSPATAELMEKLRHLPHVRAELVAAVRSRINAAGYDLDTHVARALDSLLCEELET